MLPQLLIELPLRECSNVQRGYAIRGTVRDIQEVNLNRNLCMIDSGVGEQRGWHRLTISSIPQQPGLPSELVITAPVRSQRWLRIRHEVPVVKVYSAPAPHNWRVEDH